jgi:hypothetical protein
MKKILFISIIPFLFLECKKEPVFVPGTTFYDQYFWGTCTAKLNGKDWNAKPFYSVPNAYEGIEKDAIAFRFSTFKDGFPTSALDFARVSTKIKSSKINILMDDTLIMTNNPPSIKNCGDFYTLIGGDSLGDQYVVSEKDSLTNLITITDYDPVTTEIKGTFSVTFYLKNPKYSTVQTLRFTEGKFHTKNLKK